MAYSAAVHPFYLCFLLFSGLTKLKLLKNSSGTQKAFKNKSFSLKFSKSRVYNRIIRQKGKVVKTFNILIFLVENGKSKKREGKWGTLFVNPTHTIAKLKYNQP